MEVNALTLLGAGVLSLVVGALTGIFGVGGGFLLTPSLIIFLRVPPAQAVGTGLIVMVLTSSVGLFKRRGTGTVDGKLAAVGGAGAMLGAWAGQRLLQHVKELPPITIAGRPQGALEYLLMWLFMVFLTWIAALLYFDYRQSRGHAAHDPKGLFSRLRWGPTMVFPSVDSGPMSVPALLLLGMGIGSTTGLMGIGGGVLWLPALFYLVGQPATTAAGTSLLLVWLSSFLASALNLINGNIHWPLCLVMLACGMTGCWYGTHVGLRMAGARLRFYFIYVILAAMVIVGCKLIAMTVRFDI